MEKINELINTLSFLVWGTPLLILLIGTGIFLIIKLRALQIRKLPYSIKVLFERDKGAKSNISHFSTLLLLSKVIVNETNGYFNKFKYYEY